MADLQSRKRDLLRIYQAALAEVDGFAAVHEYLHGRKDQGATALVAIGKAAQSMALGAKQALGECIIEGLVISKYGHIDDRRLDEAGLKGMVAGHPEPDDGSLRAGQELLSFLRRQPADRQLLFLISGGASSLVEVLPNGLSLEDLKRVNAWLLGSGLAIDRMNRVRKRLSLIKGGGLLNYIGTRQVECLLISDVPGDDVSVIGSGLLIPSTEGVESLDDLDLPDGLSELPAIPRDRVVRSLAKPSIQIIANLAKACQGAEVAARGLGYPVVLHGEFLSGMADEVGRRLGRYLLKVPPGIHIWGGETTVCLPKTPGRGGRCQHLALAVAAEISGHEGICLLAAGTDGSDGPTEDAGALVDGGTLERADIEGLDVEECLARANSGTLLAATGDLINTGPTGTNVMDLVIGWKGS